MSFYPDNWPRCPNCGDFALDGHITCGRAECDEGGTRSKRNAEEADQRWLNPGAFDDEAEGKW